MLVYPRIGARQITIPKDKSIESLAPTEEIKSTVSAANVIQLERKGDRYTMSVARFGKPFVTSHLDNHKLGDDVYVGLFVCSHNAEVIEKAVFRNVRITVPAPEGFGPYRDYIGSRLETLDMETGDRRVLLSTSERIEAPNWTPDGTTLIYTGERNGEFDIYQAPIDGGESQVIAYLYGGQGTINVPSWAPDSRHLAFVSNTNGQDTN